MTSIVSINDLFEQRDGLAERCMLEMAAIKTERVRQADERWKLMSDLMHRRDTDVDKRIVDLMTTVQDLAPGVKSVVTQTAAVPSRPPPVPVAFNSGNVPSASVLPTQQPYKSQSKQTKQPKLQPPAMYKKGPAKSQIPKALQIYLRFCKESGPPSFDPFARGASTTGDYNSVASGQMSRNMEYRTATGGTEYHTAASSNPISKYLVPSFGDNPSRPLALSTQSTPASYKFISGNKRASSL